MKQTIMESVHDKFKPDYTPMEILQSGSFGGIYFNNKKWRVHLPKEMKEFLPTISESLWNVADDEYDKNVNKYKFKGGNDQAEWERCGWLRDHDPRGWFQWYCNYYYGRRLDDDARQINRWVTFKARHGGMLRNNLVRKGFKTSKEQAGKFPVIRQNLLHWAIDSDKLMREGK